MFVVHAICQVQDLIVLILTATLEVDDIIRILRIINEL